MKDQHINNLIAEAANMLLEAILDQDSESCEARLKAASVQINDVILGLRARRRPRASSIFTAADVERVRKK